MITTPDLQRFADELGSADDCVARVLELSCARGFALDALLRLSRVEWCHDVTTAAVECSTSPRLLLNPKFVYTYARQPQALMFLLLHELAHVSFGQTGVYTQATQLQNIAFDAVINASLIRGIAKTGESMDEWKAFLFKIYKADESPSFLLRPPPFWPPQPNWDASAGLNPELRAIHRRLYKVSAQGELEPITDVTHSEIIRALMEAHQVDVNGVVLLGSHGETETERRAATSGRNAHAAEVLGGVLGHLPADGASEPGRGTALASLMLKARTEAHLVRQLTELLKRSCSTSDSLRRPTKDNSPFLSVSPTRDRRAALRRIVADRLGGPPPVFYVAEREITRSRRVGTAAVYLDVSGSMQAWRDRLYAALRPLRRELAPSLYAFSTVVAPLSASDMQKGRVRTTDGTDINAVLTHATQLARRRGLKSALVLTDGLVGAPSAAVLREFRDTRVRLHVACTHELHGNHKPALSQWAASFTQLNNWSKS